MSVQIIKALNSRFPVILPNKEAARAGLGDKVPLDLNLEKEAIS